MEFRNLFAYQKAFTLAMEIFEISRGFPSEEKYALTDQIRRSSRSVCANLAEAYRKRIYPNHFISKLTDSDAENSETQVWLEFAQKCGYLSEDLFMSLETRNMEVGKLLQYMMKNPEKFGAGNTK